MQEIETQDAPGQTSPGKKQEWPYTDHHLRANIPAQEETRKPTPRMLANGAKMVERNNRPLPGDIQGLQAEHNWLWHMRNGGFGPVDRDTLRLAAQRHALVKEAINAITQGDVKPIRPESGQHVVSGWANPERSKKRAAANAAFVEALDSAAKNRCYFYALPIAPSRKIEPWARWLLGSFEVLMSIGDLRQALCAYQVKYIEAWNIVHYRDRIDELKQEISNASDTDEIKALQTELSLLQLPTAADAASAAAKILREEWRKCDEAIDLLLLFCCDVLEGDKEVREMMERSAYANHPCGLGGQDAKTTASKAVDKVIEHLVQISKKEQSNIPRPASAPQPHDGESTILNWIFGLSILGTEGPSEFSIASFSGTVPGDPSPGDPSPGDPSPGEAAG